jgi:hypothetical protein
LHAHSKGEPEQEREGSRQVPLERPEMILPRVITPMTATAQPKADLDSRKKGRHYDEEKCQLVDDPSRLPGAADNKHGFTVIQP